MTTHYHVCTKMPTVKSNKFSILWNFQSAARVWIACSVTVRTRSAKPVPLFQW